MSTGAYLDHAATTPMRPEAVEAMLPFLSGTFGNPSGQHAQARAAKTAIEEAREAVAAALGAHPGEVIFTGSGTEADNLAVKGAARSARDRHQGDGIVTSAVEHHAVLHSAERLERDGFRLARVGVDGGGVIDLEALAAALDERTALVSVMLANNEVGTVQPLAEVAALMAERAPKAVLHTDAVQAAPWLDLTTTAASAHLIAVSAHKFGGPKGVGALVVRKGTRVATQIDGGGQERDLRSGTHNVAGIVGMAAALDLAVKLRDDDRARVAGLRDRLADGLVAAVRGARVNGAPGSRLPNVCHLTFPGVESETLLLLLDREGICAAAGSSCSSGAADPSHVLAAMGLPRDEARSSVRLSLGWCTTEAEVDAALSVVPAAVAQLPGPAPLVGRGFAVRALVAMSGGVDSSVAAARLQAAGHDVVGITLKLWGGPSDSGCCSVSDVEDARRVAAQLGVAHYVFNLSDVFEETVVAPYVGAYATGRTPNPCVECNRTVKFGLLLERAMALGFDVLATGHHARRAVGPDGRFQLRRGRDRAKDQSYVLYMLGQAELARTVLPVGELTKAEVRAEAAALGLRTAEKPESMDVCFITKGGRELFLEERGAMAPGPVVDTAGRVVGQHSGAAAFTVGQRRGVGVATGERRYVVDVDAATATVTIGGPEDLLRPAVALDDVTFVDGPPPPGEDLLVQWRAHGRPAVGRLDGDTVVFDDPQGRVAPGQVVALYRDDDQLVGGGIAR